MEPKVFSREGFKKFTTPMKVLFGASLLLMICQLVLAILSIFTSLWIADVLFIPAAGLFWIVFVISVIYISKNRRAASGQRVGRYAEPRVFSREGYKRYTTPMKVLFWAVCLLVACQPVLLVLNFFSVFNVLPWQIAAYVLMILFIVILFNEARKVNSRKVTKE